MSSPYAPSIGGYALGLLVSGLVVLVPSVLALGPYAVFVLAVLVVVGIPVGVVGAVLTHLACRDAPHQGAHVLVAGLWGFGLTLLLVELTEPDPGLLVLLPTWIGVAAAVGRASVIRLVPDRRPRAEVR